MLLGIKQISHTAMLVEVSVAVNYILSHLYSKLPRRRVDNFGEELEKHLCVKFQHHWYPNEPARESNFRCLCASGSYVDPLFSESAIVSGLDWSEIQACLPEKLILNVDPGYVACQYQQTNHTTYDFNRYSSNPHWPSSISLSSSGCSSASSNSSTSSAPSSVQMVHQILYCIQEGWTTDHEKHLPEVAIRSARAEQEQGDQLATAAALSVLVDAEDNTTINTGGRSTQSGKPSLTMQNLWGTMSSKPGSFDINAELHASDTGFNSMESSKLELSSGYEVDQFNANLPWGPSEKESDSCSISPFISDIMGYTKSNGPHIKSEESQALAFLNKSSSDLQHLEKLNVDCGRDCAVFGNNSSWTGVTIPQFQSRLEQQLHPLFGFPQVRVNPAYPSTLITNAANPFVQKSTSTPSFTAATFAQTKFGSTKLKNHAKRAPNRILSPTAAPQQISTASRESLLSTILGVNQRIPPVSHTELFALRRPQPNSLEARFDNGLSRQPIPCEKTYSVDCSNVGLGSDGHSNPPSDSSSGSGELRNFPFGTQPQNMLNAVGGRPPTMLNCSNTEPVEHGFKSPSYACARWPPSLLQLCQERTSCFGDTCTSSLEWTEQDTWSGGKRELGLLSSLNGNNHTGVMRSEQVSGLVEDALLSARMVNLLLEDGNTSDDVTPELEHTEGKAALIDPVVEQTLTNEESREANSSLDSMPCFSGTGINTTSGDASCVSHEVTQQAVDLF